jgi:hypothetical protein
MDDNVLDPQSMFVQLAVELAAAQVAEAVADAQIDDLIGSGFPIEQMDLEFQSAFRAKAAVAALQREIEQLRTARRPAQVFRTGAASNSASPA